MKILILSQPKSGSTAMFYKVKAALPEDAPGYFEPTDLGAVAQEVASQQDAVCKYLIQPWNDNLEPGLLELIAAFDKVVVLHRDPRDFMVSCYLYSFYDSFTAHSFIGMAQALAILERKEQHPGSISFLELVHLKNSLERRDYIKPDLETIPTKRDLFGNRLDLVPHPLPIYNGEVTRETAPLQHDLRVGGFLSYVFRSCRALTELKQLLDAEGHQLLWMPYADLVAQRFDEVNRYLGIELAVKGEVDEQYVRVVRTKGQGDWKNWTTASDLPWLQEQFGEYLEQFGYGADWELPAAPRIDPAHGSDYVFGLFAERHKHQLSIERSALRELGDYLWHAEPERALWLPGLASGKVADIGPEWVHIEDVRFEDAQGKPVNMLIPGASYSYVYRVRFDQAVSGVAFWMQVTNTAGDGVLNGSSLLGDPDLRDFPERSWVEVRYPFVCELKNGYYFCNVGVSHKNGSKLKVLRRRVAAVPLIVFAVPAEQQWLIPMVTTQ